MGVADMEEEVLGEAMAVEVLEVAEDSTVNTRF